MSMGDMFKGTPCGEHLNRLADYIVGQDSPMAHADSWERLWDDASRSACAYFGDHESCEDCPAGAPYSPGSCRSKMACDIVRRARALAERGE